jgi:hypothetical protein
MLCVALALINFIHLMCVDISCPGQYHQVPSHSSAANTFGTVPSQNTDMLLFKGYGALPPSAIRRPSINGFSIGHSVTVLT